ncbi:hypothetical protein R5R35_002075 [Gryllus longicercus]|uniref:Uncharacterized protein n=1 Tax=Gryllus longicercus TaxID=2509291 RepID=A0AAN9YZW2_9ORTH
MDVRACWNGRGLGWSHALCIEGCICDRPHYVVLCHCCGFHCMGRLRIQCKSHPNVKFLMDIDHCPKCKAQQFMMSECCVEDFPRPADLFPPVIKNKPATFENCPCNANKKCQGHQNAL